MSKDEARSGLLLLDQAILVEVAGLDPLLDEIRELSGTPAPGSVQRRALGSVLHDYYTGLEKVFMRIATAVDEVAPSGRSWRVSCRVGGERRSSLVGAQGPCIQLRTMLKSTHQSRRRGCPMSSSDLVSIRSFLTGALLALSLWSWPWPCQAQGSARVQEGPATVGQAVRLRARPDAALVEGQELTAGQRVQVLSVVGQWARVRSGDVEGWLQLTEIKQQFSTDADIDGDVDVDAETDAEVAELDADEARAGGSEQACTTGDCKERARATRQAAAAHPAEARRLKVAVYTLKTEGELNLRIADLVTDSLVAEIRKLERLSTISMSEIQDMLTHAERKRMLGCEADECLIEIGGALGVDLLITGSIGAMGESHLFNLRAIDVNQVNVRGRVSRRLKGGNGEEFLEAIGPAVEALFPEHPLREGFARGVAPEVARKLDPPPLPTVWFWTTAGLAAATALAGAGFGLASRSTRDDWNRLAEQSKDEPIDAAQLQTIQERMDRQTTWANGLFISAGALALAAGVEALFTDWRGDRSSSISLRPVATVVPGGGGIGGLACVW